MKEANESARNLMRTIAAEMGRLAKDAQAEATLWSKVAEALVAGDLLTADAAREEALKKRRARVESDQTMREMKAIAAVDPAYWADVVKQREVRDLAESLTIVEMMTVSHARLELELHKLLCPNRDCEMERALRARIERG